MAVYLQNFDKKIQFSEPGLSKFLDNYGSQENK